ncbi:MAG: alpha/beta fold hydrolase [Promethearchaeota archaeon]
MEFENKRYDGEYEVAGLEIENEHQKIKGVIYFPPKKFKKPHPILIYFHGFPQLFTFQDIAHHYNFLLNKGYALLIFNFRGYKNSEGQISIKNQVSDANKIIDFILRMGEYSHFKLNNVNIIACNFGAYIGLITCSKIKLINRLVLISPILDLERHVNSDAFINSINYINTFLPGSVKGINDIINFLKMTKKELSKSDFKIKKVVKKLKNKDLIIIIGKKDKVTPISEVENIFNNSNLTPKLIIIEDMDHECVFDDDFEDIRLKISEIF